MNAMNAACNGGRAGFVTPHGRRDEIERAQRIEDLAALAVRFLLFILAALVAANIAGGIYAYGFLL